MNKFFRKFHLWVSIPFGIAISIICFTGAILVFESDITNLYNKDITTVEPAGTPLSIDSLVAIVEPTLDKGVEITNVSFTPNPSEAYKVSLSKPHRAAIYIDQYSGEIKGKYERLPFFNIMRRLHRWLMDTRPADGGIYWGKVIVGISTIAFVVILLTGIVIWWPLSRKMLKNRLKIAINKGKKRFWYDLHVAGGFYAMILLLAMSLTGLTWSFEWYRNGFYGMFGAATTQSSNKKEPAGNNNKKADKAKENKREYWQQALDAVTGKEPQFKRITISSGSIAVAKNNFGNQQASDKYKFNEATGEITSFLPYSDSPTRNKVSGWVRAIHVGNWGGAVSKIIYFLASMLGASLPLTGYYLWFKRLYGKRKRKVLKKETA